MKVNFKAIYILVILLCFGTSGFAHYTTTGCLSPGGYIYTDEYGTVSGKPNYRFDNEDDRWLTPSSVYCIQYGSANSCYITVIKNSAADKAGYSSTWGTYVTYAWEDCPLDDYAGLIVCVVGGTGFFAVRKKMVLS